MSESGSEKVKYPGGQVIYDFHSEESEKFCLPYLFFVIFVNILIAFFFCFALFGIDLFADFLIKLVGMRFYRIMLFCFVKIQLRGVNVRILRSKPLYGVIPNQAPKKCYPMRLPPSQNTFTWNWATFHFNCCKMRFIDSLNF